MAKVSTKRRKAEPAEQTERSLFEMLADAAPGNGYEPPQPQESDQSADKGKDAPTNETLLAQIAALNERIASITQGPLPSAPQAAAPKPPGVVSLEGLPDPTVDPDGYARELQTRMQKNLEAQQAATAYEQEQARKRSTRTASLWQDFAIKYEDYAADKAKAEFAAQMVAKEADARGVDVERYMFEHTDRFLKAVAQKYEEVFGKPGDEEDDEPAPSSRTAGIFGGNEGGSRPAPGGRGQQPQPDMVKELHDVQRKLGLY